VLFDTTSTPKITELGNTVVFSFGIYPNFNYQNFTNGAVGLGSGAFAAGGTAGAGNVFWFDNFQVGAPGVPPQLISTVDYSDTFTLTGIRTDGLLGDNSNGAYDLEDRHGNPPATWTPTVTGIFGFKTPATSTDPAALEAAIGNNGASSGMGEATDIDFNFAYGLRSDYVVQVDAILPTDRLDISSLAAAGDSPLGYLGGGANTLSVFFRRDSLAGVPWPGFPVTGLPGIGIYNGTMETAVLDSSGGLVHTGVDDNNWHNFAVEFDQAHSLLRIYVDRALKAAVNLTTVGLPTINCPADMVVTAAAGQTSTVVTFNVPATYIGQDVPVVCIPASGSAFPVGTTTVNCAATDAFGNAISCSFHVTINPPPPTLTSLSPDTMTAGSSSFTLTVNGGDFANGATVQWNGAARPTTFASPVQLTAAIPASDVVGGPAITTVLITVLNPNGALSNPLSFAITPANVSAAQTTAAEPGQTVIVSTAPMSAGSTGVSATVNNTGGDPASVTVANYSSNPSGAAFSAGGGFTDVQIAGADLADTATVKFYYPSTIDPATEVALTLVYFDGSAWAAVKSSENRDPVKNTGDNLDGTISGGRFTVLFSSTSTPKITELNGTFFAAGIPDTMPPTLTCPNVTAPCSVDVRVPVTYPAPTVSDNVDPAPTVTYSIPNGSGFAIGTTTVTCTATDASGNAQSAMFTVTRAPLGFTGFLAPIGGADATGGSYSSPAGTFKTRSTIPLKFTADCGGSPVVIGSHRLQAIKYSNATTYGEPIDATPQGSATTDDQFRLVDGSWIFNLDTKATGMGAGIWLLRATLSDGSQHTAWIQLK